tara:strand:+ start:2268 stop:2762 length:495 start_codon:yes stop_codon:yes gene_type:complete
MKINQRQLRQIIKEELSRITETASLKDVPDDLMKQALKDFPDKTERDLKQKTDWAQKGGFAPRGTTYLFQLWLDGRNYQYSQQADGSWDHGDSVRDNPDNGGEESEEQSRASQMLADFEASQGREGEGPIVGNRHQGGLDEALSPDQMPEAWRQILGGCLGEKD